MPLAEWSIVMQRNNKRKTSKILYAASTASHLQRFHQPYIHALQKKGHEVLLLADGKDVDFSIPFDKHFFSVSNLKSIRKIHKILKNECFDLILVHTTLAAFLVRAATVGLKRRPYVKNIVHGYLFSENEKGLRAKVLLLCEKLMRNRTDEIIVMNDEDLRIAQKHRLCKGTVSFVYGMGLRDDLPMPTKAHALRQTVASHDADLICTFVGELSARKNQIFLIRAVERLRREGIPMRLLLIGEGSARAELEQEIISRNLSDSVLLLGNRNDVLAYLGITDLYVCASRSEGLPFNLLEAMHCGLPILASDVKGQNDLLREHAEMLYPLDDMDAFCQKVHTCYRENDLGVGAKTYENLKNYRLGSVFETDLTLMTETKCDE